MDYSYPAMFICGAIFGSIISIYIFTLKIKLPTITATTGGQNCSTGTSFTKAKSDISNKVQESFNETIHLTELHENDLHKKIEEEQKK